MGAVCALISSLCFIGVVLVPLNRAGQLHNLFLYTASLFFLMDFLLLLPAVSLTAAFPHQGAQLCTAFAFLLAGSLLVFLFTLFLGLADGIPAWEIIHATGQKILVAASILTGLIQVLIVQPLLLKTLSHHQTRRDERTRAPPVFSPSRTACMAPVKKP